MDTEIQRHEKLCASWRLRAFAVGQTSCNICYKFVRLIRFINPLTALPPTNHRRPAMSYEQLQRIEVNPAVMVGKPVIRGTRIPVEFLVRLRAQGISDEEILEQYPRLQRDDIHAALAYAAEHGT